MTLRLGFWQYHRAQEKEEHAAQRAHYEKQSPIPISPALQTLQDVNAKPVKVRGYFIPERTIYLDNRPYQGAPGFYVLTPLQIATPSSASYVLINRGWLPRNFRERAALAPYTTPRTLVDIEGIALAHPGKLWAFQKPTHQNGPPTAPDIRQNIDPAVYQLETGWTMQPFIIEQHNDTRDHLIRDWPKPAKGIERHYGYMVQWWGLSAAVLGFGLYCALRQPSKTKSHTTGKSKT